MNFLFFDTETTGLPKRYDASYKDLDNWPRIIQFAWAYTDETGTILASSCELVKPNGWLVPCGNFWVSNGFSQNESECRGIEMSSLLYGFLFYKEKAIILLLII